MIAVLVGAFAAWQATQLQSPAPEMQASIDRGAKDGGLAVLFGEVGRKQLAQLQTRATHARLGGQQVANDVGWTFAEGRPFTEAEFLGARSVCVLGNTVVDELFGQQDPVGARIRLKSLTCEVVGVLAAKGQGAMGQDQDSVVVLPHSTAQRRLAGQVGVNGHIKIGDGVTATGQSGVTKDTQPGLILSGTPAGPHREEMRKQVLIRQLPDFIKRVKALEERMD